MIAKILKIWQHDYDDNEDYTSDILSEINAIGKDNLISINDHGYVTYLWFWGEEE